MPQALKTLRILQWSMLASILLYVGLGESIGSRANVATPTLNYLFSTLAVAVIGAIFVVRRTMVFPAAESLASHPDDSLSLAHWRTGYIATYVLCESLALFGIALRFLGCYLAQCAPFYFGAFVLLLFFRPRLPQPAS